MFEILELAYWEIFQNFFCYLIFSSPEPFAQGEVL